MAKTNQKGESACSPPPMLLLTPHRDMSSAPGVGGHHRSHLYILPDVLWMRSTMVSKDKEGTEAGESTREEQRETGAPMGSRERPGAGVLFGDMFVSNSQCFCPSF